MTTPEPPTDLYEHVEWLKREVAVPGTFTRLFPETTDDHLAASLVDGLYRAKLDGWLPSVEADPDTFETNVAISQTAVAVVIVYSAIKFIQNQITNMPTGQRYEAPGGIVSDTQRSASVLAERLRELNEERKQLVAAALGVRNGRPATTVTMLDGYAIRVGSMAPLERGAPLSALTV